PTPSAATGAASRSSTCRRGSRRRSRSTRGSTASAPARSGGPTAGSLLASLGGSYGGFIMAWIEGNWPDRFRCIVNHDGVFDQRMMYYATDELWFNEWEMGGPQYQNPQGYEQANPLDFVSKWRTPMLVVHGEQDF